MAIGKAQETHASAALARGAAATTGHLGAAEKPAARFAAPKMREQLTAVFIKSEKGDYCGYVEEIPGAITQGETLEETRENLVEAVQLVVEGNRYLSDKNIAEEKYEEAFKEPLGEISI